jgi:Protein of unknown function (DUF3224)
MERSAIDTNTEKDMTHQAAGKFEIKLAPAGAGIEPVLNRMSLDKLFHGDLEAFSKGEMLSAMSDVKGSGGYVALERVEGTLAGRTGTFILQHYGTMNRGVPHLLITVVPDSGTAALVGLTGKMEIAITHGDHFYDFQYSFSGTH